MDIEFQVKMVGYQHPGMKAELRRVVRRQLGRSPLGNGMAVLARVLSIVLCVFFFLLTLLFAIGWMTIRNQPEFRAVPGVAYIVVLAVCALCLLFVALNIRRRSDPIRENLWPRDAALVTATFCPDFFQVDEPYFTSRVEYHAVQTVSETPRAFYLLLHGEQVLMLRKREFLQGSPEQFRDYIAAATGQRVEHIKA